jgi:2-C-methyl-D-erythritol 2,4-cyclodiphosphate synthase
MLLRKVKEAMSERSLKVGNIDSTLVAQAPRLAPHLSQMIQNIAADLGIMPECVNIKATTTEKLGFVGREEGIAAHAVVLLLNK